MEASARTYIVEIGDTWELVARKWGIYTDALHAANTLPPSLNPANWDPSMFEINVSYDAAGTPPMYSSPGMAAWMRQSAAEVGNYAASVGARIGGAQGHYLQSMAGVNMDMAQMQAVQAETPHYAPTQEDIERERELSKKIHDDFRESLTSAKDNVQRIKEYNRLMYGTGSGDDTEVAATPAISSTAEAVTKKSATDVGKRKNGNTTSDKGNSSDSSDKESYDAHKQFKNGNKNTNSHDYDYKKHVDLYRRDGAGFRQVNQNVELYHKGATYYIKLGNTFHPLQVYIPPQDLICVLIMAVLSSFLLGKMN